MAYQRMPNNGIRNYLELHVIFPKNRFLCFGLMKKLCFGNKDGNSHVGSEPETVLVPFMLWEYPEEVLEKSKLFAGKICSSRRDKINPDFSIYRVIPIKLGKDGECFRVSGFDNNFVRRLAELGAYVGYRRVPRNWMDKK